MHRSALAWLYNLKLCRGLTCSRRSSLITLSTVSGVSVILCDIGLFEVKIRGRGAPTSFRDLYDGWIEALSAQTLNTRFYRELANWFFWSVKQVTFPAAAFETDKNKRDEQNQIAVIRLLTRVIFVWFIKEKGLVPEELFDLNRLRTLLKEDPVILE